MSDLRDCSGCGRTGSSCSCGEKVLASGISGQMYGDGPRMGRKVQIIDFIAVAWIELQHIEKVWVSPDSNILLHQVRFRRITDSAFNSRVDLCSKKGTIVDARMAIIIKMGSVAATCVMSVHVEAGIKSVLLIALFTADFESTHNVERGGVQISELACVSRHSRIASVDAVIAFAIPHRVVEDAVD